MRILFILASDLIYKKDHFFTLNNGFAPLSLTTLAACVPDKYHAHIEIIDEGMQNVNYDKKDNFDIVSISCCASSSNRAYYLSKYWKKRGAYITIGGVHATLYPEDVKKHCDTIMLGYGEDYFAQFIDDFAKGTPSPQYESHACQGFLSAPRARRDLIKHIPYYFKNTIVANRGCSNKCRFCSISQFNKHQNGVRRPVGEVIQEIKDENFKKICFLDPSLTSDMEYAKELLTALIPLKIKYYIDMTINSAKNDEFMDLLEKSGCYEILCGFETFNSDNLANANKKFNLINKYKEYVKKFHSKNISILGTFVAGMPYDTKESILEMPELIREIQVDLPKYSIYTPFPGTEPYEIAKKQKILLTNNFDYYDLMHVVHKSDKIPPYELQKAFHEIWLKTFSLKYILERSSYVKKNRVDILLQNLYFKHLSYKIPGYIDYLPSSEQSNCQSAEEIN